MASGPFTDEERDRLRELHAQGLSLHEIARRMGRGKTTISRHAASMGLSWDRSKTIEATKARTADVKALRAELKHQFLVKAGELLAQMDEPYLVFNFGGKDNSYNDRLLDRPPTADLRNLMTAAAVAVDKHAVLERLDSDGGAEQAKSMIGELAGALRAVADHLPSEGDGA